MEEHPPRDDKVMMFTSGVSSEDLEKRIEARSKTTKPEIDHTMTKQTKYLKMLFGKSSSGQTAVVYILSARTDVELGRIKWFGQWRQYAFYPNTDKVTIFNMECMNDIIEVIRELMVERA